MEISHTVWITFNGVGVLLIFLSDPQNRCAHASWSASRADKQTADTETCRRTHTHTRTHANKHRHTHTHADTHTDTHRHTQTHTHTLVLSFVGCV